MSDFQFLVIGAGPGGYVAALRAARLGLTTGIIENRQVGGTCLNRGCIPTKSLLHSASLLSAAQNGEQFGLLAENIGFDFSAIHRRKTEVVELLRGGILQQLKTAKVTLLVGTGVIVKPGLVRVGEQEYTADHILIATGSVPAVPPIPGIHLPGVVTSDELLCAPKPLYRSLVIIGGGVIGVELAGFYAALGCEVTILEAMERILPTMEREISQSLAMVLKKRGIKIFTGCTVSALTEAEDLTSIHYISKGTAETVVSQAVLCAIGRRPNTQGLLGEGLSLSMKQGRILVDESFKTSLPNIYAIGDVSAK
ncbi:MAG: FAD-dependent oxidoreductase, partial [Oscillospiraceae bacterium]